MFHLLHLIIPHFNFLLDLGLQCTKFIDLSYIHRAKYSTVLFVLLLIFGGAVMKIHNLVAETMILLGSNFYGYQKTARLNIQ